MDSYTIFAQVYDELMDNIPYAEGCEFITTLLKDHGINDGLLAELGCGTGSLTELLSQQGYDMIGIDNSEEMLDIAMEKRAENGLDILYLLQDMREFELYGTVAGVISYCDSVNYITNPEELEKVFRLVDNYLDPDGLWIFDFHTPAYYEELGESTIAEDRDEISFIWDNYYDPETKLNEYYLSIFIEEEEDLFRKYQEEHVQRAYSLDEIKEMLSKAGLIFETAYDGYTRNMANEYSNRIVVVARESGRKAKELSQLN